MRLRNIPGAEEAILNSEYCIKNPEEQKGHWQDCFNKVQPLHIEIGMGKGRFIMDMAALHPDINYIGIERYSSVLLRALQKMEQNPLPNIKFICMDAADVAGVFAKDEVDRIYLNFSDPWPKDRHAKRRLTSRQFFARYDQILKNEGFIRTDRRLGAFVSESIADDTDFTEKLESELELLSAEACLTGMSREEFLSMCDKMYSQMKPCTA